MCTACIQTFQRHTFSFKFVLKIIKIIKINYVRERKSGILFSTSPKLSWEVGNERVNARNLGYINSYCLILDTTHMRAVDRWEQGVQSPQEQHRFIS